MFHVIFHRIQLEEWHSMLKSVGFVLFSTVFVMMLLRALLLPRKKIEHASSLPFENEKPSEPHAHDQQK